MKPLRKCKRNNQNKETKTNLRQNITCWFFKEYRKKTYTYGNKTKESKKNCLVVVISQQRKPFGETVTETFVILPMDSSYWHICE